MPNIQNFVANRLNSTLSHQLNERAINDSLILLKPLLKEPQLRILKSAQDESKDYLFNIQLGKFLDGTPSSEISEKTKIFHASQSPSDAQKYLEQKLGLPVVVLDGKSKKERLKGLVWYFDYTSPDSFKNLKNKYGITGLITGSHGNGYKNWYTAVYSRYQPRFLPPLRTVKVRDVIKQHPQLGANPAVQTCSSAVFGANEDYRTSILLEPDRMTQKIIDPQAINEHYARWKKGSLEENLKKRGYQIDSDNRITPENTRLGWFRRAISNWI